MRQEKNYYNNTDISFLDKEHFYQLPKEFKKLLGLNSFENTLDKADININNYEMIVQFNKDSKYINKETFKLDEFDEYSLEYKIKKENKKENDGKMTLTKCFKKFCKEENLEEGNKWYCSKCKKYVLATKKMEFYYLFALKDLLKIH